MHEGARICVCVRAFVCHLKPYLPIRSKCKKYSTSAKPEVCNADINSDAFAKMVEESLLSANSPTAVQRLLHRSRLLNQVPINNIISEAMLSKCEFKDSNLRTWKQRIPYFWPKEARGKWSLQIVAH